MRYYRNRTRRRKYRGGVQTRASKRNATMASLPIESQVAPALRVNTAAPAPAAPALPQQQPYTAAATFGLQPPTVRNRIFLKSICSDANFCTTFGRETDRINQLFNFATFDNMLPSIKLLAAGNNGFVNELTYEVDNYFANAVLKTTIAEGSDNVYLEAYNGVRYINKYAKQFPCFLETYGAFELTDTNVKQLLIGMPINRRPPWGSQYAMAEIFANAIGKPLHVDKTVLKSGLTPIAIPETVAGFSTALAEKTCVNNAKMSILIQYVHEPINFWKWFDTNKANKYAFCVELPIILFQIYAVLATLDGAFTHFDLHEGNVLLYKIPNNGYVTITYKNVATGGNIVLKTPYIVKVIDYGRAFLPDNQQIYTTLCNTPQCTQTAMDGTAFKCGETQGYAFFEKAGMTVGEDDFYISTNRYNNAHDLRLVNGLYNTSNKYNGSNAAYVRWILAGVGKSYETIYGTPHHPNVTTAASFADYFEREHASFDNPIYSVQELYWVLCAFIRYVPYFTEQMNEMYLGELVYGTLEVDLQFSMENLRPMFFVKELSGEHN